MGNASSDNSGGNDSSSSNDNNSKYHSDNNCSSRCVWTSDNGGYAIKDNGDRILCVRVFPNYSSDSSDSSSSNRSSNSTSNSVDREGANDDRNSNSYSSSSFSSNSNREEDERRKSAIDFIKAVESNPIATIFANVTLNTVGLPSLFGRTKKEEKKLLQEKEQEKYEFKLAMQKAREENLLTEKEFQILTNDEMEHLHKSILYKKFGGGSYYYSNNYYSKKYYTKLSIEELAKKKYLQTKRNADDDYENDQISERTRNKIYESAEKEFYLRFQQTYEENFFRRPICKDKKHSESQFNTTLNNIGSEYVASAQARVNTVNLATTVIRKSVKEAFIATTSMANELISINNDAVFRQMETDNLRNEATIQLVSNVATAVVNNAPQVIQETAEGVSSFGFEVATQAFTGYNPTGLAISGANEVLSSINNREKGFVETTCEGIATGAATYVGGNAALAIGGVLLAKTAGETYYNAVNTHIQNTLEKITDENEKEQKAQIILNGIDSTGEIMCK